MQAVKTKFYYGNDIIRIHYINSIGAIIDNSLMLHTHSKSLIEIDEIRRIEIYKTRSLVYNALFVLCSIPLFYSFLLHEFTIFEKLLNCVLISVLLGMAIIVDNSNYVILIRKFDLNFIEIKVNKNSKEDAKKIAKIINAKIKLSR